MWRTERLYQLELEKNKLLKQDIEEQETEKLEYEKQCRRMVWQLWSEQ